MPSGQHDGPRAHKRTKAQRELDRIEMVRLLRRGYTQVEVAKHLGVHPTQINYDFRKVVEELQFAKHMDTQELVTLKLAEYSEIKKELWDAWERSKLDAIAEMTEVSTKGGGAGGVGKKRTDKRARLPENAYMQSIMDCVAAERELLGIDPAKKTEIRGQVSATILDLNALIDQITQEPPPLQIEEGLPPAGVNGTHLNGNQQ